MTGHNHYRDCTCGWCVNNGRSRINRAELSASYRVHEAKAFLQRNGARSVTGCYVNPNAKCPVCGAAVFFYANAAGSRVYFDDLGPPWPKHPCTDNPTKRIKEHAKFTGAPARRAPGLTYELVEAAKTADLYQSAQHGARWLLLVVVSVIRRGTMNTILADHVESYTAKRITLTCRSESPMFEVGDFLSMKGAQFSFFDKVSMEAVTFVKGGTVTWATKNVAPDSTTPTPKPVAQRTAPAQKAELSTKPTRSFDMTQQEMSHFHSKKKTVQQLCDQMLPIVRSYAKNGVRKPRQVAEMLNRDGYRTVSGAKWTPRLTYFLLGLVFLPGKAPPIESVARPTSRAAGGASVQRVGPMTMEDMAAKLSQLGRVVFSDNPANE
ncbi:hypothetical protein SAMN06295905_3207 [Devosia lucknowensis]|uniref:Uncharacterized protein n=1 Tax=Devosia lucknowensis TaxID=1096929 RepID=A0A1Y6G6X0_9HYPH|nr:hypothetical protein [Devosia lucknowensis]SMQ85912.1 hypothetical protein SAMN06295905_3207 [Devosia lucknowensis]